MKTVFAIIGLLLVSLMIAMLILAVINWINSKLR